MITAQKMVRKEIAFEYSLGVPSFTPERELTLSAALLLPTSREVLVLI